MGFDYRKLRGRIVEKYGSMSNFADAIGVSRQTVSGHLKSDSTFNSRTVKKWQSALDIDPDDIGSYFFADIFTNVK